MSINIDGSNDPSYRYQMPRILGKVEGRGNGIRTALPNVADVARSLKRSPEHITKFYGCELGAQSRYDEVNERGIVNGAHQTSDLQQLLFSYIRLFVLCPNCGLPETDMVVKKRELQHQCNACGATSDMDMTHKLCAFILREAKSAKAKKGESRQDRRKRRQAEREAAAAAADADAADAEHKEEVAESESDGSEERKDKKKKDKKKKDKEKKEKKEKKKSKEKKKKSKEKRGEDEDEDGEEVATLESMTVADASAIADAAARVREAMSGEASVAELSKLVKTIATNCGLPRKDRVSIAFESIVGGVSDAAELRALISKHARFLKRVMKHVDESERALVAAVERFVCEGGLVSLTSLLLRFLYDEDILEEETVLAWASATSRDELAHPSVTEAMAAEVRAAAEQFVNWLKEADEESDDDSSDSDDSA
mmetsp:Transcript_3244/g.10155  ORF Transcript_3244/g.10155 Transcript_3244/m.10155 type:complete len:426 (-) Transcript_3244:52-1329(-)